MANYKKASVIVIAESTASDTIPNNASAAAIKWTTISDQINYAVSGAAAASNGYSFVIPYTGFYQINFSLGWPAAVPGTGNFVALSINNLATVVYILKGAVVANEIRNVTRVLRLNKDDLIAIYCTQNSGAPAIPTATLSIVRVGNAS
jgi:hypothetical protein